METKTRFVKRSTRAADRFDAAVAELYRAARTHLKQVYRKLGIRKQTELVRIALSLNR